MAAKKEKEPNFWDKLIHYKKTILSLLGCSGLGLASFFGVPLNEIIKQTNWIIQMEQLISNLPTIVSVIVAFAGLV